MNLTSIKKSIITIVQTGLGCHAINTVLTAATTTGVVATGINPIIAVPVLIGAYCLYSYGKDKIDSEQKLQELNELFNKIIKEFRPQLDSIRSTEISLLEKELNNSLKSDKIIELQKFVISILLEEQYSSISDIANNLSYTNNEIEELKACAEDILQQLHTFQESNALEHKQISDGINDIKKILLGKTVSESQNPNYAIVQSVISTGTMAVTIKTKLNKAFDISIQAIWNEIVVGNYSNALRQIDILLSDTPYKDSVSAKIWILTLQAKINYIIGRIQEANNAILQAKSLLDFGNNKNLDPVLQVIHARYHVYKNEIPRALAVLEKIINTDGQISFDACALWIELVDKSAIELESMFLDQCNNYLIAEALAQKFHKDKNYSKFLNYAQISFDSAKQVNALPCYSLLATALIINKIHSETSTFGLTRDYIDKSSWPEFRQIIICYNSAIEHFAEFNNGSLLSQLYYNLAGVYFMCGEIADADYYTEKLFALNEIALSVIRGSITIWIKLGKHDKALNALAKIQERTSPEIRFLYAKLLLDCGPKSSTENACKIFLELVKDCKTDRDTRFYSLLYLGWSYLENNNIEDFNNLQHSLDSTPENSLTTKLLEALKFEKENRTEAIRLLSEVLPIVPENIIHDGDFLDIIMPILKKLRMGKIILNILEPIVPTDEITNIGIEYFRFAISEKDSKRVETFCQQLRDFSCYDFGILYDEIFFVALRSNQAAAQLASRILSCDLPPLLRKQINVCYDMIRSKLGTLKDANVLTENYPSLDDIDASKPPFPWCNIPLLMKENRYIDEAIDYAYELLLRFPQNEHVRRIYLGTILFNDDDKESTDKKELTIVSINSAVTYENPQRGIKQTVIIDDSDFSNESRHEYKSTSSLGKLLLGRKLGDNVEISKFGNVSVSITAIQSKYTYVIGKIMEHETQSPDSLMTQFHIELDSEGNPDFSEMVRVTSKQQEEQQQNIDAIKQIFMSSLSSFYMFARCSHLGLEKSLRYFASQSDLFINSSVGDVRERTHALKLFSEGNNKILLSPMTIEILLLLEATSDINIVGVLRNSGLKFCICEYIPENYRQELQFPFSGNRICVNNGVLSATTDTLAIKRHKALLSMMEFFNEIEVFHGELDNADFQAALNNNKWLWGRSLFQTLLTASAHDNIVLWDDDMTSIAICMQAYDEIKIKFRVFTQAFFMFMTERGVISPQENVQVNVLLLAINERFTSFDAMTIVEVLSNVQKYTAIQEKLFAYLKSGTLNKQSVFGVSQIAATLFASDYTDRQKAKQGLKLWFDELRKYDKQLAKFALAYGMRGAYKNSRQKSKPMLKFVANNYTGLLDYSDVIEFKKLADNKTKQKKKKKKRK